MPHEHQDLVPHNASKFTSTQEEHFTPDRSRFGVRHFNLLPGIRRFTLFAAALLLLGSPKQLTAQQSAMVLPDAPAIGERFPQSPPEGTGSISGNVMDLRGDPVPGAVVTLAEHDGVAEHTVATDSSGAFTFPDLSPGPFKITVSAAGLSTFFSSEIMLAAGERRTLPRIALPLAATSSVVQVTATQDQIAVEQVNEAVKQRAFGVFPNFYSSYIWNAAPLPPRQKFKLAIRATTDPVVFLATAGIAGVEQVRNSYAGYGGGAQGYGKRYGATYADDFIGRMLGSAILPSLLHQDPRYFYRGSGSVRSRAFYALSRAVVCKGDNGRWQPNYSRVLGSFAAGGIDNLYHPAVDRGVGLVVTSGLLNTVGNAADNLLREFLFRKVTPNIPNYERGKE